MIQPRPLRIGDTVGLLAPASFTSEKQIAPAIEAVEQLGFSVVVGQSCYERHGYFSGRDEVRAHDINTMFADKNIAAIFAIRGGYGTPRLLPLLQYDMIAQNPKLFVGYSDMTALHIAFNQRCNFMTLHAPMPGSELCHGVDAYTMKSLQRHLFQEVTAMEIQNPVQEPMQSFVSGESEGVLIGGNLSLVAATLGTPYEIDTRGKILFLEDIGEEPYRIDRMLMQLQLAGKLADAAGILLGNWNDCDTLEPERSLTLEQVFQEIIVPIGKPTLFHVQCGHCLPTMTLPLGATIRMNASEKTLQIIK